MYRLYRLSQRQPDDAERNSIDDQVRASSSQPLIFIEKQPVAFDAGNNYEATDPSTPTSHHPAGLDGNNYASFIGPFGPEEKNDTDNASPRSVASSRSDLWDSVWQSLKETWAPKPRGQKRIYWTVSSALVSIIIFFFMAGKSSTTDQSDNMLCSCLDCHSVCLLPCYIRIFPCTSQWIWMFDRFQK